MQDVRRLQTNIFMTRVNLITREFLIQILGALFSNNHSAIPPYSSRRRGYRGKVGRTIGPGCFID
jgi:hypothetical protein